MRDKSFVDTNVLVYLFSEDEVEKRNKSRGVFKTYECITSVQALNELSNVLIKKFGLNFTEVSIAVDAIAEKCHVAVLDLGTIRTALYIAERYKYSYYDSLIISSSLENDCNLLLTEDMHDGQNIEGSLTIKNIYNE